MRKSGKEAINAFKLNQASCRMASSEACPKRCRFADVKTVWIPEKGLRYSTYEVRYTKV